MDEQELILRLETLEKVVAGLMELYQTVTELQKEVEQQAMYRGPVGPDSNPEKCSRHECDYFTHYLAQGPAELVHEGYHAAVESFMRQHDKADQHEKECPVCRGPLGPCAIWDRMVASTLPLEKRIRA